MSDEGWTWELSGKAQDDLDALAPDDQDRILDKLDEIVDSPWRDPHGPLNKKGQRKRDNRKKDVSREDAETNIKPLWPLDAD